MSVKSIIGHSTYFKSLDIILTEVNVYGVGTYRSRLFKNREVNCSAREYNIYPQKKYTETHCLTLNRQVVVR